MSKENFKYKWEYPENKSFTKELEDMAGSSIIAQILVNRGIDTLQKAEAFLNSKDIKLSSPYLFVDMKKSVERIRLAIEKKEHIVIYGDFDADGVTSTSLLYKAMRHVGADVSYYVPDRATESHGLNSKAVCNLISTRKAKLLITVDNGINNNTEVKLAKSFGADVIITDHHEAPEELPPAYAILNPKSHGALDESLDIAKIEDLQNLAGVGVAYKLSLALLESYGEVNYIDEILYLAACGTIADVVPLVGENRTIVLRGLELISEKKPLGLMKILQRSGCNVDNITSDTIAFGVAPRINAAGRLESAATAIELFVEEDKSKLDMYVMQLENFNQSRQQLCETTFMEALHKIEQEVNFSENKSIVLYDASWHPGIIGIVASRLVEKFHKPVFLMKLDGEKKELRCSARSIKGLHLYETLNEISDILQHYGGHSLAAGFSVDLDSIKVEEFIKALHSVVNEKMEEIKIEPSISLDANIRADDLNMDFLEKLQRLAPFGAANPSPLFSTQDVELKELRLMGANQNHLKMFFMDNNSSVLEAVWWNKPDLDIELTQKVNLAFSPKVNSFNGKTTIQLELKDMQMIGISNNTQEENIIAVDDGPVWLDHRKKTNIYKSVNNYLKGAKDSVAIFAENTDILNKLAPFSQIESRVVNRLNCKKVNQLMLFDIPAEKSLFNRMLEVMKPEKIHVMSYGEFGVSEIDYIKKISGMLKYAHSNLNGKVDIAYLASKLSSTESLVVSVIKLLESSNVINILMFEGFECEFDFIKSVELNKIVQQSEYADFEKEFEKIQKFRHQLVSDEISDIKIFFNN